MSFSPSFKRYLIKSSLILSTISPLVLATVVSCSQTSSTETGSDLPANLPEFAKKELKQANSLVVNNQTWAKITDFNVKRNVQKEVYETKITKKYRDTFRYPAWNWDWKNIHQGQNGWHDEVLDYERLDENGNPTKDFALNGAPLLWNERTDFQVPDKDGKLVFAKYNDPRFILNEIKTGKLKKHPAAKVWFEQDVKEETKAIKKEFSIPANALGSTSVGLYAPAGEVVTLQFNRDTLNKMIAQNVNNFQVIISENFWDNTSANDLKDNGRISKRYPFVQTTFNLDLETLKQNNGKFQFGSPFGGAITIRTNSKMKKANSTIVNPTYENYNFEISGAVEMLTYMHNLTTEADWNAQIERVKNGQISAPAMTIDLPLSTMNIPATAPNQFGGVNFDQIVFPKTVVDKWTNFMFISQFLASRDKTDKLIKLTLRFCDDIWGSGAAAWAGGDKTALPIRWAADAFLKGIGRWNSFTSNWGIFHEVNHNFQQNSALFTKRYHGETDQAVMLNLSLLSDHGRFKNLYNPLVEFDKGTWRSWNQRTSNSFNSLTEINRTNKGNECDLVTLLAYQFGSFNLIQYIRNDVFNAPNTGGMREVIELSDAFKVNLWPAIQKYSSIWAEDEWKKPLTPIIQKEIDRIAKYKTIDFVGNLFATGSYTYDQPNNQFVYTNDTSAPLAVATNVPYVFDFEKGITSLKNSVTWDELIFNPTTKLGGQLIQDKTNSKRLIYVPPKDVYNQIDEFDIAIKPTNKDTNYIDQYKWKIKTELVSNLPLVTMYNEPKTQNNSNQFIKDWEYMKDVNNFAFQAPLDPRTGIYADQQQVDNQWQRAKVSFNFVAPESGKFDFKIKGNSWFFIDVDKEHKENSDQIWWKADKVQSKDFMETSSLNLQKGESVKFDVYLTERKLQNTLEMIAQVNEKTYDVFDHVTSPFAKASEQLLGFKYLPRAVDQDLFQSNLLTTIETMSINVIDKSKYNFKYQDGKNKVDEWIAKDDGANWEIWGSPDGSPITIDFDVDFNEVQTIGSIIFNHRTSAWLEARATSMIIKDQDDQILYNGKFGNQFDDRNKADTIFNFDHPLKDITKLKISLTNTKIVGNGKTAISLDAIQFSSDSYYNPNRMIAADNKVIQYFGPSWELVPNNSETNISAFGNFFATTNKQYENFETTITATGFDIIGQTGPDLGAFDLYVNGKLVVSIDANQNKRLDQQILASFRIDDWSKSQDLKIKLINKTDKPIRIDGIQTYGNHVLV